MNIGIHLFIMQYLFHLNTNKGEIIIIIAFILVIYAILFEEWICAIHMISYAHIWTFCEYAYSMYDKFDDINSKKMSVLKKTHQ